ncbi:MAG: tRNA (guanosine(37)-N1)-methyltransferase TrmD [Phycisphaerae bacterium]|nr:tRNA (guanosine(37)-N1)-methyltransferase TrmD [Phycisphaerae bacterium]
MRIKVLTLFPEVFAPFVGSSIIGRAVDSGLVTFEFIQLRDSTEDKHRSVDDKPFGGGAGMVLMCGPMFRAVEQIESQSSAELVKVLLTPQGERLGQSSVRELAAVDELLLICGHYEGFDERIRQGLGVREVSVGDFILSGGESAAIVLIDAVVRLLPGALGDEASAGDESFEGGLLEYPQYTRPRSFRGMEVPEVLLSGNHAKIAEWRMEQAIERTRQRRPELM